MPSPIRPRPLNLLRCLAQEHEVRLCCLLTEDYERQFIGELRSVCEDVEVHEISRLRGVLNAAAGALRLDPPRLAYFRSAGMRASVRRQIEAREVDLVHIEHAKSLWLFDSPPPNSPPVVYDAVDCLSLLMTRRRSSATGPIRPILAGLEQRLVERFERKSLKGFAAVLASSAVDCRCLGEKVGREVRLIPNGIDRSEFRFSREGRPANEIIFCAKLDYFPNRQAAFFLARDVFPRVRKEVPAARLRLVGVNPSAEIRSLSKIPGIAVTGYVNDIAIELTNSTVAVAPLLTAVGIQNKILQAMAVGTPVVASRLATEGLDVAPGRDLLVGETSAQIAAAVVRVLNEPALGQSLASAGFNYVRANHDWSKITHELTLIYRESLARAAA